MLDRSSSPKEGVSSPFVDSSIGSSLPHLSNRDRTAKQPMSFTMPPYRAPAPINTTLAAPTTAWQRLRKTIYWRIVVWWQNQNKQDDWMEKAIRLAEEVKKQSALIDSMYPQPVKPKRCWFHRWRDDGQPYIRRDEYGRKEYVFPQTCTRCKHIRNLIE
jgi:hypothetical protein